MHNLYLNQRRDWRHDAAHVSLEDLHEASHEPFTLAGEHMDMQQALARMSPARREVLLLVTVEEYTHAEAARMLDIPVGTVMSRVHRAREQLRGLVHQEVPTLQALGFHLLGGRLLPGPRGASPAHALSGPLAAL